MSVSQYVLHLRIYICSNKSGDNDHISSLQKEKQQTFEICNESSLAVVWWFEKRSSALEMFEFFWDLMKIDVGVSPISYRQASLASSWGTE